MKTIKKFLQVSAVAVLASVAIFTFLVTNLIWAIFT